ncbi:MAG: hypothetical protein KatS3mg048_0896 [Caldilinea sp.]|jgi:hypothetical protein|nr:MAG: hypothetical protein KatS3mg048_0896 [Caldilinea sp.]
MASDRIAACRLVSIPPFGPLHPWRGLFVAPFYFYFGFFGYRGTPTRVGATMTPE